MGSTRARSGHHMSGKVCAAQLRRSSRRRAPCGGLARPPRSAWAALSGDAKQKKANAKLEPPNKPHTVPEVCLTFP
eukprot:1285946-Prymnesium_polylepis.1